MSPVGDEEIVAAIIIVVADTTSLSPAGMSQACFLRDIGERSVLIVVKEVTRGIVTSFSRRKACSVYEKNIEPAIVVVIEQGHAAAHFLQEELLVRDSATNVFCAEQTSFRGYVSENNWNVSLNCPEVVKSRQ